MFPGQACGLDLIIGAGHARLPAPEPDNNGGVYVFRGASGGGFIDYSGGVPLAQCSYLDPTNVSDNYFADGSVLLGDINNNGVPELLIGAWRCTYDEPVARERGSQTGCLHVDRGDYRP